MAKRAFGAAALLVALLSHQAATAAASEARATAIVRQGIAIHTSGEQILSQTAREERTVRIIVRPCRDTEPHILCTMILTEVH